MAAYLIAQLDVNDPAAFEPYRLQVPAVVAKHGGRYLVRGGAVEVLEGGASPRRTVVLEFESVAKAKAFYHSDDYAPLMKMRQSASTASVMIVEGLPPT